MSDPEAKRKTIGRLFIDVFEAEAKKIGGAEFLAQGTLYPDVIESVSFTGGPSVTIKSHHNVGGLPERMNMKLVEPLRELFKDEVRALGRELGLPDAFVGRHPFPGPGLAIRVPGEITREKLDILRKADAIYLEEIRLAGLYDEIWQAFAVLLPVKTVGVMGDGRTYDHVCALARRHLGRRHDGGFLPLRHDASSAASRRGSSTRSRASTGSPTTSPRSRPGRSSGSRGGRLDLRVWHHPVIPGSRCARSRTDSGLAPPNDRAPGCAPSGSTRDAGLHPAPACGIGVASPARHPANPPMLLLVLGLVLFLGTHAFTMARGPRARLRARLGRGRLQGALLAPVARRHRPDRGRLRPATGRRATSRSGTRRSWTRHLALLLVWFAFVAFARPICRGGSRAP